MHIEIDADNFGFGDLQVDAKALELAITDPRYFYRFANDGKVVTIERYEVKDLEGFITKNG